MSIRPSITVFNNALHSVINTDAALTVLDSTCRFTEGPVWNSEGFYLFSDIPGNVIYKVALGGAKEVYLTNSGCTPGNARTLAEQIGSNGLAYDSAGNLWVCQHGDGAVARWDGSFLKPHISQRNGKPFNSPNDLVVHSDGAVFFSDPPYGLKDQTLNPDQGQTNACFYCWRNGELTVITDRYKYPNGLCLSPDGKRLYTCSSKPFEAFVLEWDVATLQLNRELAAETSDGIKCDKAGNLFLCTKEGIVILNADGQRLGLITLDAVPANCCWGGAQGLDLFVTARQYVFLITGLQKSTAS